MPAVYHPRVTESATESRPSAPAPTSPALPETPTPVIRVQWAHCALASCPRAPSRVPSSASGGRHRSESLAFHCHCHVACVLSRAELQTSSGALALTAFWGGAPLASAGRAARQDHSSAQMPDARLAHGSTFVSDRELSLIRFSLSLDATVMRLRAASVAQGLPRRFGWERPGHRLSRPQAPEGRASPVQHAL